MVHCRSPLEPACPPEAGRQAPSRVAPSTDKSMVHLLFPKRTIGHRYDLSKRLSRPALHIAYTNQRPVNSCSKFIVLIRNNTSGIVLLRPSVRRQIV